jgi:hypothetical protein
MANVKRLISSVLLVLGVLLVLFGLISALGFTAGGVLASVGAIAALLYAGATWFSPTKIVTAGNPAEIPLIVFDRERRIVSGPAIGQHLTSQFPAILRPEIERRTAAALAGTSARFPCLHNGRTIVFDALPVHGADGTITYGILLTAGSPSVIGAPA